MEDELEYEDEDEAEEMEFVEGEDSADERDEEDEDEDELEDPGSVNVIARNSVLAESGIIERITLKNFLCHELLNVELGPHINFITGENGSGKSAILIGLCTCFGLKASETNRGSSFKDLIRHGQEWAEVEVTLANRGQDAFKPEIYGPSIRIVRELRQSGSSSYKTYTHEDIVIGRRRSDVAQILDHFSIQVENPCVVMNQDCSREFLQSNKNEDKYRFFLKATQLQKIGDELEEATVRLNETKDDIDDRTEQMRELRAEVKNAKDRYEQAQSLQTIDAQINDLECELIWSQVSEKEDQLKNHLQPAQEALRNKLNKLDQQMSDAYEQKQDLTEQHEEESSLLLQEQQHIQEEKDQKKALKDAWSAVTKDSVCINSAIVELQKRQEQTKAQIKQAYATMTELMAASDQDRADEQRGYQEQLGDLNMRLGEAKEQMESTRLEYQEADQEHNRAKSMADEARKRLNTAKGKLSSAERRESQLRSNMSKDLGRFGTFAVAIDREIQKQRSRFQKPPLGPLGAFVSLTDGTLNIPIENALGGRKILGGYLVDNFNDQTQLSKIFSQVYSHGRGPQGHKPVIFISAYSREPYQPPNLDGILGETGAKRLLDCIEVSNASVFNILMDKTSIDVAVALDDTQAAVRMLRDAPSGGRVPMVFTTKGTRLRMAGGCMNDEWVGNTAYTLGESTEADLKKCQQELEQAKREVDIISRDYDDMDSRIKSGRATSTQKRQELSRAQHEIARLESDIVDIQERLDQASAEVDEEAVEGQRSMIERMKTYLEETKEEMAHKKTQLVDVQERQREAENNYRSHEGQSEVYRKSMKKRHNKITNMMEDMARLSAKIGKIQIDRSKIMATHDDYERQVEDMRRDIEASIEEAEKFCERIEGCRKQAKIESKISALNKRKIDEENRMNGTLAQIQQIYCDLDERYQKSKSSFKKVSLNHMKLVKIRQSRFNEWRKFVKHLGKQANLNFQYNLSQRGHEGAIEFDHKAGTLSMNVKTAGSGEGRSTTDTKALSGGERAFATLSFVVAVGESIRSPFRAMDEPDIFMDSRNRRIAIELLVDLSTSYMNRQFIFITPLDLSMVQRSATTKIWKLADPNRSR